MPDFLAPGRKALPYLLIAPALFVTLAFEFYPVLHTFYLSVQHYVLSDYGNRHYVGLANFKRAFGDENFWRCLRFSCLWVFCSVGLQFGLGMAMALLLNQSFHGRGLCRAIVLCPWAMSGVVVGLIWSWMFHGQAGVVNDILMRLGIIHERIPWLAETLPAMIAVIAANVWQGMPFFTVTLLAALQTIPPELYEAAEVDGGGPFARFRHITLPMIRDMVFATVLLRCIWTFNGVDLIYTMTGGGPVNATQTLATYIFTRASSATDYGYGAALAVILFAILIGSIALIFKSGAYRSETSA